MSKGVEASARQATPASRWSSGAFDYLEAGLACLALASTPLLIYGLPLPLGALAVSVAALCVVVLARAGYATFTASRG